MDENAQKMKLVALGNSGVGKTCLINRWVTGFFDSKAWLTVGANHIQKEVVIDGQRITLSLWDTAGGDQYQALVPLYARGASVAIFVVDISEPTTFDSIGVWKDLLLSACPIAPPMLLAINKVDLVMDRSTLADVMSRFGTEFSEVFFVSAKSGESIEQLFERAAQLAAVYFRETGPPPLPSMAVGETVGGERPCC
jgi:small GTP-binding protein